MIAQKKKTAESDNEVDKLKRALDSKEKEDVEKRQDAERVDRTSLAMLLKKGKNVQFKRKINLASLLKMSAGGGLWRSALPLRHRARSLGLAAVA